MPAETIIKETVPTDKVSYWVNYLTEMGVTYLPKIAAAILTLVIGWWLIGRINK